MAGTNAGEEASKIEPTAYSRWSKHAGTGTGFKGSDVVVGSVNTPASDLASQLGKCPAGGQLPYFIAL